MKISELSDADLSRWIAEKEGWRFGTNPNYPNKDIQPCWWFKGAPYSPEELPNVNDPGLRWTLLKSVFDDPRFNEVIIANDLDVEVCITEAAYKSGLRGFAFRASSLERLPAEAFALANGWTE